MHEFELILGLLAVVVVLAAFAKRIGVAYPVLLVLGGLGLGFIPGLPHVEIEPELVFLLFLPPILFSAAYFTSWRDFRANARPIGLLSIGLVLFTTVGVAVVAEAAIPELTWAGAFVLGAIVSPPDAVATTAIIGRLGVPRRMVTIVEGESLVNDATALVALRFAVAAVVTGSFSFWDAGGRFALVVAGGVAIGLVAARIMIVVIPRITEPAVSILATLLCPVAAYLPAEELGVSGVLATVTAGLIFGHRSSELISAQGRLRGRAVWEFVVFLINGLVFILIGLQLPTVLEALDDRSIGDLIWYAALVSLTTIVVRILWMFPATYLPRKLIPGLEARDPSPPWQMPALLSWTGLRGVVTLAAALSLPFETDSGAPFPARDLILFLAFAVILVTLVVQGLSLPGIVRLLGITADREDEREELLARREATSAALSRLDELDRESWLPREMAASLRADMVHRLEHIPDSLDPADLDGDHHDAHHRLEYELLLVKRRVLVDLRNRGAIGDEVLRRVEYDLDLVEERSTV